MSAFGLLAAAVVTYDDCSWACTPLHLVVKPQLSLDSPAFFFFFFTETGVDEKKVETQ